MTASVVQVGCGHWGKNLARNWSQLGALVGVADADPATAARIAAELGVPAVSLDDALADPAVTAIVLATPAPTHAALALRAMAAGKHVFVEKPLALDPDDARAMVDAAKAANRILMVGHLLQYHPAFIALRGTVGRLGPLRYVYSNRLSLGKIRTEENVLWSFAPHDLSMILALAGEAPCEVRCEGAAFVTPGIADWALCSLRFPSGVRGHVQVSWCHPFKEQRLVVVGSEGMAVFDDSEPDWNRRLAFYPHEIDGTTRKADAEYIVVPQGEPLRAECEHFLHCIATGTVPRTDGAEGLAVLDVLHRAEAALADSLEGTDRWNPSLPHSSTLAPLSTSQAA